MRNKKTLLEFIKDILTEYFAAATFPILILLGGWLLTGNSLLILGLMLVTLFAGFILGWWVHFLRTLKIYRTHIGKYDSNLEFIDQSSYIDMMAITFADFFNFEKHIKIAMKKNNARVRVLLLNTDSEAFKQYANKAKESKLEVLKEEEYDAMQIILDIHNEIQEKNLKPNSYPPVKGSISYEFFDRFPFRGCVVSDKIVHYWPYLEHLHPSSIPTYEIARDGQIGNILAAEFEHIWNESVTQRLRKPWSVQQIISGGQTGADRAALDWAIKHNIPHSGWCPKGRLAEDGVIEPKYILKETSSSVYEERTELNVRDSDATVIFTIAPRLIKGSLWTLSCAKKYKKPWIHL